MDHLPDDGLKYRKNNNNYKENGLYDNETKLNNKSDDTRKGKVIGLVFVSLLLDLLAFTMILPLLPSLLDYYDKEEGDGNSLYASLVYAVRSFQKLTGAPDRFASVLFGGALGSMYSFLQFLTSPIVGSLSDAYGRKPMLLICLTGIAVSHALWSCASTFSVFVLARFIGGLSKANVSLSMAIVTDASGEKTRARGMALVGLAFSIGFIVGPMAGAWFAKTNDANFGLWGQRPALYALSLSLANIALVFLFLPETLSKDKRSPLSLSLSKAIEYVSPWHLLKFSPVENLSQHQNKVLSKLGLIYFMYLFIYSGLEFTITFLTHHTFAYTAMQQGKMFLVIGVIMAALQGKHRFRNKMPLFSNKFTPKTIPVRRNDTSVIRNEFGSDYASKELSIDLSPLKIKLGDFEVSFEEGQWIPASGRAGAAHKENLRLKKELEQLEEENNMLRLKFEILLDMMTDKTVEAEQQQQADMQRAQSLSSLKKNKKQKW
ncbi:PREDICTED: major facilitator superfamily domain-containing protein 10-like [Papilio polytes]|uniref:major facilitator superfamily domain-containing protein 10-like n=1 Tax=Papilio polytes TaxID=76194 RepID=UPI00067611F8|nr:PREDICTED: major facilitator superfamily domain-containing protein 10-like [Papilio polytes]